MALLALGCGGARPTGETTPLVETRVHAVALGGEHSCARHAGGTVSCWGNGGEGQLGDGGRAVRTAPVAVPGLTDVEELTAGASHTCARTSAGRVLCWGTRRRGQVGDGHASADEPALTPTPVVGMDDAVQISAGDSHTCAVRRSGRVACWGDDLHGQLGRGGVGGPDALSAAPVDVAELTDAVEVRAGGAHTCARTRTGRVLCWGDGAEGQVGEGGVMAVVSRPVPVAGLDDVLELSLGARHSCARHGSFVACWGDGAEGQLGDGTRTSRPTPADVVALDDAMEVDAGGEHTCARLSSSEVRCWGRNALGQLGDGTLEDRVAPARAQAMAAQLATGAAHTCALDDAGAIRCWGSSRYGQLGDGRLVVRDAPVRVTGIAQASAVRAGGDDACALVDGRWQCWGDDAFGQVGDGDASTAPRPAPTPVTVVSAPDDLVIGAGRACAIRQGTLSCWGRDEGARMQREPRAIAENVRSVALGTRFACALGTDGHVSCWGEGTHGELGRGDAASATEPAPVAGLDDVVAIAAGDRHACALLSSGHVRCWGAGNLGQLGDGAHEDRSAPVDVQAIADASDIAAGLGHTCVVHVNGAVSCWGSGRDGQLGNGTTLRSEIPIQVAGIASLVEISAGAAHTCGRTGGGVVYCWGASRWGQIGRPGDEPMPHPMPVAGVHALALASGDTHTCALTPEGVTCWGSDASGQLGDAATLYASEPVRVSFAPAGAPAPQTSDARAGST